MTRDGLTLIGRAGLAFMASLTMAACSRSQAAESDGPVPVAVEQETAGGIAKVDHPEQFPLVSAEQYESRPSLSVTGVVTNDVSRAVAVLPLVSGRALDVRVRLGDEVRQGQLLMRIKSADVSSGFSDYRHAVADEILARAQLERAKELFERGAIAQKDLEVAQDTEDKAKVDLETTAEHLRVLGADPAKAKAPSVVDITAPMSGVITEQNVTSATAVRSLDSTPNLFTISDLSRVWILCDVYENDLPSIHLGDSADIRLNAYPDRALTGRVSNVLPILDPSLRTAKVRVELANPGFMRLGMFATAIFHGQTEEMHTTVPASAVVHMHDRDWVYVPSSGSSFRRIEVVGGGLLPGDRQEVRSGLAPGQRVVSNALVLERTIDQ